MSPLARGGVEHVEVIAAACGVAAPKDEEESGRGRHVKVRAGGWSSADAEHGLLVVSQFVTMAGGCEEVDGSKTCANGASCGRLLGCGGVHSKCRI